MIRLFANANYDFIKWRRWAYALTAVMILPGLVLLLSTRLNYSIEFTGGTLIQIATPTAGRVGTAELRAALDAGGLHGAEIQQYGADTAFVIRARLGAEAATAEGGTQETLQAVTRALDAGLGAGRYHVGRYEAVGPKVGKELQGKAFLAIFFSFIVTLIYLAFRFEWRFGLAAVLATFHDILATIAFIRYTNLEVSLEVVGAVLLMIGYSLNDTIIIFDQRNAAALDPDARHHDGGDARARVHRRRGDPAVRARDDVRDLYRHVLLDLHRGPRADVHREALAGAGRARRPVVHGTRPRAGRPDAAADTGEGVTCSSTPIVTWGTGRSTRTVTRRWRGRARRAWGTSS